MGKIKELIMLAALIVLPYSGLSAQGDGKEYLSKANSFIAAGNYSNAVSQLEAYKAFLLINKGLDADDKEVLTIDRQIYRANSSKTKMSRANSAFDTFKTQAESYCAENAEDMKLPVDTYESLASQAKSIVSYYKSLTSVFPKDKYSSGRIKETDRLLAEAKDQCKEALLAAVRKNPSEGNINTYIAFVGTKDSGAASVKADVASWNSLKTKGEEGYHAYLGDEANTLFREQANAALEEIERERTAAKTKIDNQLWANTVKTSKTSLQAYLDNTEAGDVKNFKSEAESLIASINAYEKGREEEKAVYLAINKNSKSSIEAYLDANPKSTYSKELNAYLSLIEARTAAKAGQYKLAVENFEAAQGVVEFSESDSKLYAKSVKRSSSGAYAGLPGSQSTGNAVQVIGGLQLLLTGGLSEEKTSSDSEDELFGGAAYLGLKFGSNSNVVNFEAACKAEYNSVTDFEVYPFCLLRFNFMNSDSGFNLGVGGGYRIMEGVPSGEIRLGWANSGKMNWHVNATIPFGGEFSWAAGIGFTVELF